VGVERRVGLVLVCLCVESAGVGGVCGCVWVGVGVKWGRRVVGGRWVRVDGEKKKITRTKMWEIAGPPQR